jgi:hypothetical protein
VAGHFTLLEEDAPPRLSHRIEAGAQLLEVSTR